ncbi:hypothetical protein PF010_g27999 [Phytophthora fragariae]|uniref:Uncharacterized protein n=1 Tax=Phytophthora fragariae TaxID=53985 RepID=A0A6G0JS94_9STRA|nr:hypothetical protein PF010_g27999 [Phytophthora fragariae]KAE9169230.1 hypothetical protein PF004_g28248 [Phytophthora fragariae]
MGNTAAKAREAHAQAKSKPKTGRSQAEKLPEELLELSALRTLDLSSNKLSELPPQLNALKTLKTLKVPSNVLTTLPDLSGFEALTTSLQSVVRQIKFL